MAAVRQARFYFLLHYRAACASHDGAVSLLGANQGYLQRQVNADPGHTARARAASRVRAHSADQCTGSVGSWIIQAHHRPLRVVQADLLYSPKPHNTSMRGRNAQP